VCMNDAKKERKADGGGVWMGIGMDQLLVCLVFSS